MKLSKKDQAIRDARPVIMKLSNRAIAINQAVDGRDRKITTDIRCIPNQPCQFMGGMEISEVCGKPTVQHYSYCAEHKEICYQSR
tara:strand:+ start:132 stop:386 length:255 start_codon:yes stop_codon:yes gene_type:complete